MSPGLENRQPRQLYMTNKHIHLEAVITLSGTLLSAHPIQRTLGCCPSAEVLKKVGSAAVTSAAHCSFEIKSLATSG